MNSFQPNLSILPEAQRNIWPNSKLRSLKKEKKVYMWDWSVYLDEPAMYENMVASHLFKFCNLWEDARGEEMALQFLRNAQGKEIDFMVVKIKSPGLR